MITSEKEIRFIGYGAMLTEGFVSMIALVAATVLIPGDYFAINSRLSFDQLAAMGFPVSRINELSAMIGVNVAGRPGGAVSLAVGMASILGNIPGLRGLMAYWYNFALMFEALFILTTVDAGTRVARFLLQEFGGLLYKPFANRGWMPGIAISSLVVVLAWGYLIFSGSISTIWPMFGVTNQLLAGIALGVGTTIIIRQGKWKYAWTTFVPMVFLFGTTFFAAAQLFRQFILAARKGGPEAVSLAIDGALMGVMIALAALSLVCMVWKWARVLRNGSAEVSLESE
jgi:carbon starvation protein